MILVPPPRKPLRTWRLRRLAALTAPFKVHSPGFEDFFCFFCFVSVRKDCMACLLYPFLLELLRPMSVKMQQLIQLLVEPGFLK